MTLREFLKGIADAIRTVEGSTGDIPAPTYRERILALSGGGGGASGPFAKVSVFEGPDGEIVDIPVNIKASVSTEWEYVYTHFLYNGVRLPKMPDSVLASYPYAWIRNNTTSGYYDLLMCSSKRYYNGGIYPYDTCKWYRIEIASAASATEWTYYKDESNYFGIDTSRPVLWSNHDIPNGSATATDIYFEGTDPVPTL